MGADSPHQITDELLAWHNGDRGALDRLMPVVYSELHRQAKYCLRNERPNHTLSASDLINNAFIRLIETERVDWRSRAHFFGAAVITMRRILVDYARKRQAEKRGGGAHRVELDSALLVANDNIDCVLAVHDALESLASLDARRARIVELKFFAGLNENEIAEVVGVSPETVRRNWRAAKAWLSLAMAAVNE